VLIKKMKEGALHPPW